MSPEAENSVLSGFAPFSDDELRIVRETVESKLGWVPRDDPFGPYEMLRDAARMLATIEQVREEALDDCTRFMKQRNEAIEHLRYIRTNREWGKSILYPELDEFLERFDAR